MSRSAADVRGMRRSASISGLRVYRGGWSPTFELDVAVGVVLGWAQFRVRVLLIFDQVAVWINARRVLADDIARISVVVELLFRVSIRVSAMSRFGLTNALVNSRPIRLRKVALLNVFCLSLELVAAVCCFRNRVVAVGGCARRQSPVVVRRARREAYHRRCARSAASWT